MVLAVGFFVNAIYHVIKVPTSFAEIYYWSECKFIKTLENSLVLFIKNE